MAKVLAFDIGGTHMRCAVVKNHKIVSLFREHTPKDKKQFLNILDTLTHRLLTKDIKAIGVSIAGVIVNGKVTKSPNLPINNFNLKQYLERKYKRRVVVYNDAGCFSLAELKLGSKKKNFVMITLGTGIGSGLVINGKLYNGGRGLGGEVGHMYVDGVDFESHWKKTRAHIKRHYKKTVLFRELVKMKDSHAREILQGAAYYLGKGFATVISILDPEMIVVAGGPSESKKVFIDMIKKEVDKHSFVPKKTPVKWTSLTEPGILGASLLVS